MEIFADILLFYLADYCCLVADARSADIRTLLVSRTRTRPTSATEPSVQLDIESGTNFRRTSDSRTCHTAVLDSH